MREQKDRYEIFLKVCETGSFSKAAEALNYTQSGISQMMAGLEEELGVQLFARINRGVTLTPEGEMLYSRIASAAVQIQEVFSSHTLRIYINADPVGCEIGGALKNIIALAAGICDGLHCGDNTKAALMTRGIHEITNLGVKMGGKPETFGGLSGIGDLIVTCASMHSRNRRAGILMGQGKTMEEAMAEVKMVVEGVYSAKAARELSRKYKIDMPIIEEVNEILFENKPAKDAVKDLMFRDKKPELAWE